MIASLCLIGNDEHATLFMTINLNESPLSVVNPNLISEMIFTFDSYNAVQEDTKRHIESTKEAEDHQYN